MSKKKPVIVIVIFIIVMFVVVKFAANGNRQLVNPGVGKEASQIVTPVPTPAYNPPKEIKYDSSTDLKKELETVDPQVLDSDFTP